MQTVSCPSCGAPLTFRSHAAVMAVCEYCHASVLKDGADLRDLGKMSSVLEDYSPIQIGTAGVFGNRPFTVVGRIQLRYGAGMWNEWFLLFDDGANGWLGDSSGMFTVTTAVPAPGPLPEFDAVRPGQLCVIGAERLVASEKRVADCIGGQGELPFRVGAGWQAHVIDLRRSHSFVTLDYSDGDAPTMYAGKAVTLDQLACQLLRDDEQIKESAGKYRGRVAALACPACGAPIAYLPGLTGTLVCQSCHSTLDATRPEVALLAKGEQLASHKLTLALGAQARIAGASYRVIGAMVRADDEGEKWTEYLLYDARAGFSWLVETAEGWSRATVMAAWPEPARPDADSVRAPGEFKHAYGYTAVVRYAAGAFNWRVAVGDQVRVDEFVSGTTRLAAERTSEELTWSQSVPVADDQLRAWFGKDIDLPPKPAAGSKAHTPRSAAQLFTWIILGLNLVPLLVNFGATIWWVLAALVAIWIPPKFFTAEDS